MSVQPRYLDLKLEADTETVEDLVRLAESGAMRVPSFQRGLRWETQDVLALFDSVYRGYPVGSLLLRRGPADAARLSIGPISIDAPETRAALWVVDGQQRLTALTAGLARRPPIPSTPTDPWVVYFNPVNQSFVAPSAEGSVPTEWVPVAQLLDATALSEWVFNWPHATDARLRTTVFQAGTRIRQYRVPIYVVDTDDEQLLRDIFYRINNYGKSLKWAEVHDALFGRTENQPSTLGELASELERLGMGRPEEEQLLPCLLAFRGLDVTRTVAEHYQRDPDVLRSAVYEALPALRSVLSFLRRDAEIPHLRLLPRSIPLVILSRFFAMHREPTPRTLELLVRWTWRALLNAAFYDERTLLRHGVAAISSREEASVHQLLSLVPNNRRVQYELPLRFDARAADSRVALIAMAALQPLDVLTGESIDVAALIETHHVAAFRKIIDDRQRRTPFATSPANRALLGGHGAAKKDFLEAAASRGLESAELRSHGVTCRAITALLVGDSETFLSERALSIQAAVQELGDRLAAWSRNDRPSIAYLLNQADKSDV